MKDTFWIVSDQLFLLVVTHFAHVVVKLLGFLSPLVSFMKGRLSFMKIPVWTLATFVLKQCPSILGGQKPTPTPTHTSGNKMKRGGQPSTLPGAAGRRHTTQTVTRLKKQTTLTRVPHVCLEKFHWTGPLNIHSSKPPGSRGP